MNRLIAGDCLDILPTIPAGSVDLTVIDPPYAGNNKANSGTRYNQAEFLTKYDDMTPRVWKPFMRERLLRVFDAMRNGSHLYVFVGSTMIRECIDVVEEASFRYAKVLVWDQQSIGGGYLWRNRHELIVFASKGAPDPIRDRSLASIIPGKRVRGASKRHPFQKSQEALRTIIRNASDSGQTVLDCFAGSGSTLVAAQAEGRNYLGMEISEGFVNSARQWLAEERAKLGLSAVTEDQPSQEADHDRA